MTLSDELRDELAQIAPLRRCCRLAEISALFHSSGAWHLRGGTVAVHLDLVSSAGARRAFALLRDLGVRSEIRTYRRRAFDRATRYQLHVDVDATALSVLRDAGVLSASGAPQETAPKRVVGRACCRRAYLRGALLGAGSLTGPRHPHLEIRASAVEGARFLQSIARTEEVPLAVAERRGHALAYAKGRDAIAGVLALAGAGDTALGLEEHAILATLRGEANRLANADEANLERVAGAAHRQLEAIRALGLDALPPELAGIAELRLRHPSASLSELGAKARPPLSKSAAHRRLKAVERLLETQRCPACK
ncbi:MAG TPA: DNA-binding protein WhiA [Gaiellaceae bacterium]|nr:DNA-binding protein WhiA [Gaiellaceae bacterium]